MSKAKQKTAYSISLPFGETLDVLTSANAWWMDQTTLEKLILALKIDCSLVQACTYAGITLRQYKYFISLHPKFRDAVSAYQLMPAMEAQMTIMRAIREGDGRTARWYLKRKMPDEFGSPSRRKRALQRQQIEETIASVKKDSLILMDPEIRKLTEDYERRLRELLARKRAPGSQT